MPHEMPIGFTEDGKLHTALRFTESELADIYMANEMYMASPEAKARLDAVMEQYGTPGTITIKWGAQ